MASKQTDCREHRSSFSRRHVLTLGALTGLDLLLPEVLRARESKSTQSAKGKSFGRAKCVIMLYLHGGHPQHETWDPKPTAPQEVRGEFGEIATAVNGFRIGEHLPKCAEIADRLTIIRSLTHGNTNHVQASLPAQTGHKHSPAERKKGDFPPSATDFPPFGAVLDHLRPSGALPNWVRIGPLMRRNNGTVLHGQLPGFLGDRHSPFVVDQELLKDDVEIEAVAPQKELPVMRLSARRRLLAQIDAQRRMFDQSAAANSVDEFYDRAFNLLSSSKVGAAFELASEPNSARERYGESEFGQRCLLARRLAEAGVPMVNVHFCHTPRGSWDTHGKNFSMIKETLAPRLDTAFSALVTDLEERGMLDETLVIATAEFGRTPKINKKAGRDHWPFVYSIAMAGAGLQPGLVYGSSDKLGAHPASHPHDPADLAATIYHLLGVPADTVLHDRINRPHQLVVGRKIDALLA